MPFDNRRYNVHKPVEPKALAKSKQDRDLANDKWLWQVKYDGCCCIAYVEGDTCHFYSREGNEVFSLDHIGEELDKWPSGVYFGEVWAPGLEFREISGRFRRQKTDEQTRELKFVMFDLVPLDLYDLGHSPVCFDHRWIQLVSRYNHWSIMSGNLLLARTAVGGSMHHRMMEDNIKELQDRGIYETDGYVAKERAGLWTRGAGRGGEQIKVKDHMSVDLRVLSVEMGEGKFSGMLGSLICDYKGELLRVSGGTMTDVDRSYYWANKQCIVGHIVEVHGLKPSGNGLIREPRFNRMRDDKTEPSYE